jgi:hypothetical protein
LSQQIIRMSLSAAVVVVSVLWETKPSKNIEASPLRPPSNPIPEEFVSDSPRDADPSFSSSRRPEKARVENCGDLAILDEPSRPMKLVHIAALVSVYCINGTGLCPLHKFWRQAFPGCKSFVSVSDIRAQCKDSRVSSPGNELALLQLAYLLGTAVAL